MSPANLDRLRRIKTLPQLVAYLRDVLDWPIDSDDADEITFDYVPSELGLDDKAAVRIKEIKQLRPLASRQPWGIFFINFEKKNLPVTAMRRILRALALRKRASANKAERQAWQTDDLLFISAYGEDADRALTFAHFVDRPDTNLAELRVLGWDDDDTPLKLDYVVHTLAEKLRWSNDFADDPKLWRKQWSEAFRIRHGHVIKTAAELADALAILARRICARATKVLSMETGDGEMRTLQRAFQNGLIHDLDDAGFADMFAQTVTYGLFSLACRRTTEHDGTAFAKEDLTAYFTSPFLQEMLGVFLGIKSYRGRIDFDELGIAEVTDLLTAPETHMRVVLADFGNKTRGEDPVIHFYEHFLTAYNKKLKVQRGVFYTPQPVVSYIVRSVHELLQTEFGLKHGLADTTTWGEILKRHPSLKLPPLTDEPGETRTIDANEPFVQILDPATGTATFPVEVIEVIYKHLHAQWQAGGLAVMPDLKPTGPMPRSFEDYWNLYVPQALLPRLHGYELMMAPYAIAHMKIGLKLSETGYRFSTEERARIYLTNALEPWVKQLPLIGFDALAHEAAAVNEIKRHKRFTVVIGNPPYSGISSNMTDYAQRIVDAYKMVDGGALNERKLWLQDDYVKFIRTAQTIIESTKVGVFGYITNHGYLDNPTFRGMRQSLMETFSRLCVLDLHGNSNKKEQAPDGSVDKPVFDIKQGVAICLATRGGTKSGVTHAELWGSREVKYAWLSKQRAGDTNFTSLTPDSPFYLFEPQNTDYRAEYDAGWKINEVMPTNCAGFITARDHFVVALDEETLLERIGDFSNLKYSDAEIRTRYFEGCGSAKYPDGDSRGWKVPEARRRVAGDKRWKQRVRICSYRPFDQRNVYWADWMIDWPRPEVSAHMLAGKNIAFHVCRQSVSEVWAHVLVARGLVDDCYVSNKSRERGYVHPLFLYPNDGGLAFNLLGQPNLAAAFLRQFASVLRLPQVQPHGLPAGLTPEDIFNYAYAVFHSPEFRSRYAEFLKIDFPRLPLTGNLELFRSLARLGGELTNLHLLESPKLDKPITEFVGSRNPEVEKVSWSKNTVWVDKAQSIGFRGVREPVWNFHIGGYQVCAKWLKDRKGRTLTKDDIAHYHKVVVALSETIRLMAEIDTVIKKHGGWPGAFVTAGASAPSTSAPKPKNPKVDLGLHTEDELPLG
jgi:hypothetical protein